MPFAFQLKSHCASCALCMLPRELDAKMGPRQSHLSLVTKLERERQKVDEPRLIVVCHFLHRPPVLIARLYLTHQDKYLHQGGCPALARWRECRRALLGRPGLLARRVGRRKGYRFHLQGLIGGMEGLWVLVRVIRSFNVLV